MSDNSLVGFVLVVLVVLGIVFAPLAVIWSLNTLFHLGIAYTFKTWVAVLILGGAVKTNVKVSKK